MRIKRNTRCISMFLTAVMVAAIALSCFGVQKAEAVGEVQGIKETWYYVRNADTGYYLDVAYGIDANGANVIQYSFNGDYNQQWRPVLQSNGYYILETRCSSASPKRVLHVNGTNVDIASPFWPGSQEFEILRMSHLALDPTRQGLYRMRWTGNYDNIASQPGNGGNVFISTSATNSYWSFIPVEKGYATLYTTNIPQDKFVFGSINTTGSNAPFQTDVTAMGYSSRVKTNFDPSGSYQDPNSNKYKYAADIISDLKSSQIWVHNAHAGSGVMAYHCKSASYSVPTLQIGVKAASGLPPDVPFHNISTFPYNSLASCRVFISLGCESAMSTSNGNLIDSAYLKGAHSAIGWTTNGTPTQTNDWLNRFMVYSKNVKTVEEAVTYANTPSSLLIAKRSGEYAIGDKKQVLYCP